MSTNKTPIERFWPKVNKDGPIPRHRPGLGKCWVWTAAVFNNGYGRFTYKVDGKDLVSAHRSAWSLFVGPIPDGQNVLHHCDNRPCVNYEAHLFLGTCKDNTQDLIAKGRRQDTRGTMNGQSRLTDGAVLEIRSLYANGLTSCAKLGRRFGISPMNVWFIVRRKTWRHLP